MIKGLYTPNEPGTLTLDLLDKVIEEWKEVHEEWSKRQSPRGPYPMAGRRRILDEQPQSQKE